MPSTMLHICCSNQNFASFLRKQIQCNRVSSYYLSLEAFDFNQPHSGEWRVESANSIARTQNPSPLGTPVFSASDGPFGLGCEGDWCFLAWWCRLGQCRGRFPGGTCVVEAALLWWNKVLRPSLHLAGDGLVRLGVGGSEGLADASASSTFCTGVLFRPVLQLGQWCFQGQIRGVMDHTPLQDSRLELELLPFLSGSSLMELR
jgi:hypothetical protein